MVESLQLILYYYMAFKQETTLREELVVSLKKLAVSTAALGVALGLSFAAQAEMMIGFSQIGSESGWRTSETASIKAEAEKRGIDLKFSDAQQLSLIHI